MDGADLADKHAFLCYAREDAATADELQEALEAAGIRVWRDSASLWPGEDWRQKIKQAITSNAIAFIACFSSSSLARDQSYQYQELRLAVEQLQMRHPDVTWFIPVRLDDCQIPEFVSGGTQTFGTFQRADIFGDRREHAIARLVAAVARIVGTHQVVVAPRHAQDRREEAKAWCDKVLGDNTVDFWESEWRLKLRTLLNAPTSLALTARGGSGKSVLAAHFIRYLLEQDPQCCPVILHRPDDLGADAAAVRKQAGVESAGDLSRYVSTMLSANHRVIFVVDGLDSLIGTASTRSVSAILQELADLSCLLVTCRSELWESAFHHLSIEQQRLDPLSEDVIRRVLFQHTRFRTWQAKVMEIPFYLNAALQLNADHAELPQTETGLLEGLLRLYAVPPGTAIPRWESFESLLTRLGDLQLALPSYEVPREALLAATRGLRDAGVAVAHLESAGVLWRQDSTGMSTVRLNHDLLDCFNMARQLLPRDDESRRRLEHVSEHAADLAGWTVLSMLIQISDDDSDEGLLREAFTELLRMLDRKGFGPEWMARAWAATYVLRDKVTTLMPLILECLDGQQAASLDGPQDQGGSRLGPGAAVTQEAASSLASVIDQPRDWRAGLPDQAIPVLSGGLARWRFRKRFVEALARYKHPAAAEALTTFARSQLSEEGDKELLADLAEALERIGPGLSQDDRNACALVLGEMIDSPFADARARRAAIKAMGGLTGRSVGAMPEIAEAEIISYLDPTDHAHERYSDWRLVTRYADHAYQRILDAHGHLSQPLLDALLGAFGHEQTFVCRAVASCLGEADEPAARTALISELLRPILSWDVQEACLEALDAQVRGAKSPVDKALRRWLIQDASAEAARLGVPAAKALATLADRRREHGDEVVTTGAFEVVTFAAASDVPSVTLISSDEASVAPWIQDFVTADDYAEAGHGLEPKYRVTSVERAETGQLAIRIGTSTWEDGVSFHLAMSRQGEYLRETADRILKAWSDQASSFPGILCMHCVVLTGDRKIVMARRNSDMTYAPGRWAVSFEEQVTAKDFDVAGHDPLTTAALRGYREEFGLSSEFCRAAIISAIVEFPIINLAIIAVIETADSSEKLADAISAMDAEDQEITELRFIEPSTDQVLAAISDPDLHPTAEVRLRVVARHYGWEPSG